MPRHGRSPLYLSIFFLLFAVPLFAIHFSLLNLPYFWDELGQFIPTALDLLRDGAWVAHSTLPNIHPPGVEAYLVLWYKLFGYSIPITRVAMLAVAASGLLILFLLSIELSRDAPGVPAFLPPFLMLASPLFYTQSMMAQLDMPAMVFTLLALLFFLRKRYGYAALACVALVLTKETGAVTPAVFFLVLIRRRQFRQASFFLAAPAALGVWLLILHHATGYWMGNPGFAHYNVGYSLNPVRIAVDAVRRLYYIFFAEFRWIGTLAIALTARRLWTYRSNTWIVTSFVFAANLLLVTLFGGAALERYLLPILPIYYIVASIALVLLPRWQSAAAGVGLFAGLVASLFWNPPYPFPYENNYAMVDFVRLQQIAASYVEENLPGSTVATAWPYTAALQHPEYGYVTRPMHVVETNDFHASSIRAIPVAQYDILVEYTRTWAPQSGVIGIGWIRKLLERFYNYEPPISERQCAALGLTPTVAWQRRGQSIEIFQRKKLLQ
jgi:hypothetical protein